MFNLVFIGMYRNMQAFSQLVDVVAEDQLTQVLLPALLQKAEDPVPNVKFNVSKVLQV